MTNLFDFIDWRGDLSFNQVPPCQVDLLIFSEIIHAPLENLEKGYEGQTLLSLSSQVYPKPVRGKENSLLPSRYIIWEKMKSLRRFAEVRLENFTARFEHENSRQFAAGLFSLNENTAVVAFRGTDSTLTGWKEDLMMGFTSPVPAQSDSLEYLNSIPGKYTTLYVCGHSKGGNLAMYSSALCSNQDRIKVVYSFDGPGLDKSVLCTDGWKNILPRTRLIIPESSIIGLLMGHINDYRIITSDSMSIMQHNPFYWHVMGPQFIEAQNTTKSSKINDKALHAFLDNCSVEQIRVLVETSFDLFDAIGAQTLGDIPKSAMTHIPQIREILSKLSPENSELIKAAFKTLGSSYGKYIREIMKKTSE